MKISSGIEISRYLTERTEKEIRDDLFTGLSSLEKNIPSKYFYDSAGSKLFEKITHLPEYYPSRTEKRILRDASPVISKNIYKGNIIVEFGSGDCSKISLLLDRIPPEHLSTLCYIPVDVCPDAVKESAGILNEKFPEMNLHGVVQDFMKLHGIIPMCTPKLICFFGSTIGNLSPDDTELFLKMSRDLMNKGDRFLLGLDMVKDKQVLENAYNDSKGVTAAFNRNILNVVNRLAGTDFDPLLFEHMAFYNENKSRIEMHLKAVKEMKVNSPHFPHTINISEGETIHTENSRKFTRNDISCFEGMAGMKVENIYTDQKGWFSLVQFVA